MSRKNIHSEREPLTMLVGERDNAGEVVERIYYKSPEYVVYRTAKAIRIDFNDKSPKIKTYRANHGKIGVELARIYSWLPEKLTWSEPINRQIARALSENAQGLHKDAKQMLAHAETRIKSLKTINGRLQYTISSFAMAGILLLLMHCLGSYQYEQGTQCSAYYHFSKISFFGALGGVISVSLGFPKLEIDIDANWITNCLIGASRIIISVAAAIFSYFAITSGVAFSFLAES